MREGARSLRLLQAVRRRLRKIEKLAGRPRRALSTRAKLSAPSGSNRAWKNASSRSYVMRKARCRTCGW